MSTNKEGDKKKEILVNPENVIPKQSFFDLKAISNSGKEISMSEYKGKKIMVVNVASNCGFTGQYSELEKIYKANKNDVVVLGFPANDFKDQEKGTDSEIAQFCQINYGVTFPLFKKHSVLSPGQNEVFQWLTDEHKNGWNRQEPTWNFCKYIIDENGVLQGYYASAVSPTDSEIEKKLKK